MIDLNPQEYQELLLMVGSKKALGTYLGMEPKQLEVLWTQNQLKTPISWIRDQSREKRLELLAEVGSLKKLAERLGCSEASLRPIYLGEPKRELNWELDFLLEQFERYRSVRFVAHMHKVTENLVRKEVERHELEIPDLIDYSVGSNSNAKGRRAELAYAELRGVRILADRNKLDGSQALYDFDDTEFGKVNVKSSRQYSYRAQCRQNAPDFWKISTSGFWSADHLVALCYDKKMLNLVGVYKIPAAEAGHSKTLTVSRSQLQGPECLTS